MKKVIVSLCMAGALIALSSCRSSKDAATLSSINGEWNIIEINGAAGVQTCALPILIRIPEKYSVTAVVIV